MTQKSAEPSSEKTQAALKIIREANLTMETEQYDERRYAGTARTLVEENAGFITSMRMGSVNISRHMILSTSAFRQPAGFLHGAAKAVGSVISSYHGKPTSPIDTPMDRRPESLSEVCMTACWT